VFLKPAPCPVLGVLGLLKTLVDAGLLAGAHGLGCEVVDAGLEAALSNGVEAL
jgi:hypothetical protein